MIDNWDFYVAFNFFRFAAILQGVYKRAITGNYHTDPLTANHNCCHLLCHLLVILQVIFANSVDPDQTAPVWVHFVCLYAKKDLKS